MSWLRSKIILLGLVGVCAWLVLLVVGVELKRRDQNRELTEITDRVQASQRENSRLTGQLERMKQPAWLTLLARSRLNYKQPDETVVFVYKAEKVDIIGQVTPAGDNRANWEKWWNWVLGR